MKTTKLLLVILGSLAIASCGGGGGGETPAPTYLDTTFGTSGKVTTDIGSATVDSVAAIAIQQDGKIVVVGNSNGTDSDFAMARYDANGSLDDSFSGDGMHAEDIHANDIHANDIVPGQDDLATSVAIQEDDMIVVAGYSSNGTDNDFVLTRYTSLGALDTSFGAGGKVITDIVPGQDDLATSVAIQATGEIIVAGYSSNGTDNDFVLARYTSLGALDTSFGAGGKVITDIVPGQDDLATSVAIQATGEIIVAGYSSNGTDNDFVLARYTSLGALDTSFGAGGKVITDIGAGSNDIANSVVIQDGGEIVVAGSSDNDFALARYTTAGVLDTFGIDGKVTTDIGASTDTAYSVVIQADGKIVAAGTSFNSGSNFDFALTRYTSAGVLDTSFGAGGKVITAIGTGSNEEAHAVAIQDQKIVAAGFAGDDFALVRYLP